MFIDSSAAVPLYVPEAESAMCEAVVAGSHGLFASELLLGEMQRALLSKEKGGLITAPMRLEFWAKFEEHLADGTMQLVPLNGGLVREAIDVMQKVYPGVLLRTLDAIHLATYLSVDAGPLFTRDRRMLDAAKKLGLPLAG